MAPLFLTVIRPELAVFPTSAARPELVFPGTTTPAVRPKLVLPSTGKATIACCGVRMGTGYGGFGLLRFNRASATAGIACSSVRMGMDYGGFGLLRFNPASPSMGLPLPKFSVKNACSKDGQGSEGSEEEVVLVTDLERYEKWFGPPMHPAEMTILTKEEAELLSALKEVAGKGYTIVKDVSYRMRPEPGSPLFSALFGVGLDLLGLRRMVISPVGMSMTLVGRLDAFRRIVSSACNTPLPLTNKLDESVVGDRLDLEIVQLVINFCRTVDDDVKAMVSIKYQ